MSFEWSKIRSFKKCALLDRLCSFYMICLNFKHIYVLITWIRCVFCIYTFNLRKYVPLKMKVDLKKYHNKLRTSQTSLSRWLKFTNFSNFNSLSNKRNIVLIMYSPLPKFVISFQEN